MSARNILIVCEDFSKLVFYNYWKVVQVDRITSNPKIKHF